jgi:predicted nucleotidyltransferase
MIRKSIKSKDKIREYFFLHPHRKKRVRELERETQTPLPSVIRYCNELVQEGIIKTEKEDHVTRFTSNWGDKRYHRVKQVRNLQTIYNSGFVDFLIEHYHNPPIILFGSYSTGWDAEDSDIDLFIQTAEEIPNTFPQWENYFQRELQIFRRPSIKTYQNEYLIESILDGIRLNGQVELFDDNQLVERLYNQRVRENKGAEHSPNTRAAAHSKQTS